MPASFGRLLWSYSEQLLHVTSGSRVFSSALLHVLGSPNRRSRPSFFIRELKPLA